MLPVIIQILPVALATAVVPVLIIMTLLIVAGEGGARNGVLFLLGVFLMRLVHGLVYSFLITPDPDAEGGRPLFLSLLLIVLGTVMLVSALKTLLKEGDPEAPPPGWMARIDGMSGGTSFLMGVGITAVGVKMWLFSLSVVSTIRAAGLSFAEGAVVFLVYGVLAIALLALPVLAALLAPAWADRNLGRMTDFMQRHDRAISFAVYLIFGALFLTSGVSGLSG